jgi:hypothetical protein
MKKSSEHPLGAQNRLNYFRHQYYPQEGKVFVRLIVCDGFLGLMADVHDGFLNRITNPWKEKIYLSYVLTNFPYHTVAVIDERTLS